jgi:hypothetical protein
MLHEIPSIREFQFAVDFWAIKVSPCSKPLPPVSVAPNSLPSAFHKQLCAILKGLAIVSCPEPGIEIVFNGFKSICSGIPGLTFIEFGGKGIIFIIEPEIVKRPVWLIRQGFNLIMSRFRIR